MAFGEWCYWMARAVLLPGLRELARAARDQAAAHPGRAGAAAVVVLALWKVAELALWMLKRLWVPVAVGLGIGAAILVAGRV